MVNIKKCKNSPYIPCHTMSYHVIPCYTMFWVRKSTGVLSSWAWFFHHPSGFDLQKQLGMNETRKKGTLEKHDEIEAGITGDHHRHDQNVWPDGCPEIWRWYASYPLKTTPFYTHVPFLSFLAIRSFRILSGSHSLPCALTQVVVF